MALTTRTILEIVQDALTELNQPTTSSVVNSTDETVRQLLQFAHRTGDFLQSKHLWPQLSKEHIVTIVASQADYAFPDDFDYFHFRTMWDRSNNWELIGPLSPQEWQWFKSGVVSSFPRRRFRVKGFADRQFFIDPTPSSDEAGETLVFEYQSQSWIRPIQWAQGTSYVAGAYVFNNGNTYQTTAGGTSGSTAPTHTSGSSSDGGVTWTYISAPYRRFLADTDVPLIDEDLINLGIQWRWLRLKRFEYADVRADYESQVIRQASALRGAATLDMTRATNPRLISAFNVPDTGFGN